jgi:hypothetical protein
MSSELVVIALIIISLVILTAVYYSYRNGYLNSTLRVDDRQNKIKYKPELISKMSIELLKLEFEYAKESSIQAQNDRLILLNFFLGLYTAVFGGYFVVVDSLAEDVQNLAPVAFLVLSFVAFVFILQIIRLRQAWHSAAKTMNRIKEFFFEKDSELGQYFLWTSDSLPMPEKFYTISYMISLTFALMGMVSVVVGLLLLNAPVILIILLSLLYLVICISCYYFMLQYEV